jgi:hypothetical protein
VANKKKIEKAVLSSFDFMFNLRKCEYCRGKDGKKKDVYETFQAALDTADFIEKDRGIYLSVYECPYNNGWHLTKNNASSEIVERKEILFQNNNIPLRAPDGFWEFIRDDAGENSQINEDDINGTVFKKKQKNNQSMPIVKKKCEGGINIILSGKVVEIIKNVNIEKIIKINIENKFAATIIKDVLDGIVNQITIYVENKKKNEFDSYTILAKKELLKKHKITKGGQIKVDITGKSINNIKRWCCNKILV